MNALQKTAIRALLALAAPVVLAAGCCRCNCTTPMSPLGAQSDDIWRRQEVEAAASDFVIYEHEFAGPDSIRLNVGGQDHLTAIAARLQAGAPMPVIIERSMSSVRPESNYGYPVNPNPELDMCRRNAVAKALQTMGIGNADRCVIVAPALAEGHTGVEAATAYDRGMTDCGAPCSGCGNAAVRAEFQESRTCDGDN
jgi:hypothetical protein